MWMGNTHIWEDLLQINVLFRTESSDGWKWNSCPRTDPRSLLATYSISSSEMFGVFHFRISFPSRIKVLCIFALLQTKHILHFTSCFRSEGSDFRIAGKPQALFSLPNGNPVQTAVTYYSQGGEKLKQQEYLLYQCPSPGVLNRKLDSALQNFMVHF